MHSCTAVIRINVRIKPCLLIIHMSFTDEAGTVSLGNAESDSEMVVQLILMLVLICVFPACVRISIQASGLLFSALLIPHPVATREERRGVPCTADTQPPPPPPLLLCSRTPLPQKPHRLPAVSVAVTAPSEARINRLHRNSTSGPLR
ncbi:hypothetical protein PAMA_016602 [Pampus argenteus]